MVRPLLDAISPQGAALLCWCGGVVLWLSRRSAADATTRRFMIACLLALASVVAIHTVYATTEPYLFASHAWPFVALPACVAIASASVRSRWVSALMVAALLLSAVQTVRFVPQILRVLGGV
jgi:predicted small integral membrane protein